jgi:hypothetical protein
VGAALDRAAIWDPQQPTTVQASTGCYKDSLLLLLSLGSKLLNVDMKLLQIHEFSVHFWLEEAGNKFMQIGVFQRVLY